MVTSKDIKNHSPSEFPGRNHVIYETINLKGDLSLFDLRETLVALAQNRYLSIRFIMEKYGSNTADAMMELQYATLAGRRVFVCDNDSPASTKDIFWHVNPILSNDELQKYIRPSFSKSKKPEIKKASIIIRKPKRWSTKKRQLRPKDPRGESNRIANEQRKQKYEEIIGDYSPLGKRDKDDYTWSDKTSKELNHAIRTGKLRRNYEKYN